MCSFTFWYDEGIFVWFKHSSNVFSVQSLYLNTVNLWWVHLTVKLLERQELTLDRFTCLFFFQTSWQVEDLTLWWIHCIITLWQFEQHLLEHTFYIGYIFTLTLTPPHSSKHISKVKLFWSYTDQAATILFSRLSNKYKFDKKMCFYFWFIYYAMYT